MDIDEVWIAGRLLGDHRAVAGAKLESAPWEVLGAYSGRDLAIGRCSRQEDFVAPIELDRDLPEEESYWPGVEWPLLEEGGAE